MVILQILSFIFWLLAVPFCIGLLLVYFMKGRQRSLSSVLLSGYIGVFVLLELVGIPIVLTAVYHGFTIFCLWFGAVLLLAAVCGVWLTVRNAKKNGAQENAKGTGSSLKRNEQCQSKGLHQSWKNLREYLHIPAYKQISASYQLEEKIMFVLFLLLVGFQLYMAFTRASFDGDDAYYGVQALTAQQVDVLYRVNPNNGRSTVLDVRHALALFPIWEAFIGQVSGVHATIVCHSIIPLILIPLTYMLYFQIGKALLAKRKDLLPMFMVIIALWQMFGNVSIYTNETFFLTRTWQGKSFAGNFVIPAVLWIYLQLFPPGEKDVQRSPQVQRAGKVQQSLDMQRTGKAQQSLDMQRMGKAGEKERGLWILLACLNLAGGASSSLAVLLSCLLTAGLAVLFALREKKFGILIKAGFACVPGGAYILLYLLLTHGFIQL